jgi:hypothetical protein
VGARQSGIFWSSLGVVFFLVEYIQFPRQKSEARQSGGWVGSNLAGGSSGAQHGATNAHRANPRDNIHTACKLAGNLAPLS